MFQKNGNSETSIEDIRYKRTLQEQYIQREKESITASRKVIVRECEQLEVERYDLSQHLYEKIGQDLLVLNEELDSRERMLAQREEQFAEQLPVFQSQYALLMVEEYAGRPLWKKVGAWVKDKTTSFFDDFFEYGISIETVTLVMMAILPVVMVIYVFSRMLH